MKVYLSVNVFYLLSISLPTLLVGATTSFFSVELPPCDGEVYKNSLLKCQDKSLITPDGRRIYKDYDYQGWFGESKHRYGKVYVADGDKWKVRKDQVGYFNPKTQQTEVLSNHDISKHFVLLAIDNDGSITYGNGLEYKADGTVKTKHWFGNTVSPLQGSNYKCLELPCSFGIKVGGKFSLEPPLAFYMDKYGNYKILKNHIKGQKPGSVQADYELQVYEPMVGGNDLEYVVLKSKTQAFYKDVYYKVNGFPKEWEKSQE